MVSRIPDNNNATYCAACGKRLHEDLLQRRVSRQSRKLVICRRCDDRQTTN